MATQIKKCICILFSCIALMVACDRRWRANLGSTGYQVYKFSENEKYYLVRKNDDGIGTGRLGGTIIKVGYNKKYIICEIESNFIVNGHRLPDEIHVIQISNDSSKIIDHFELKTNPEYRDIVLAPPASFY